MKCGGVNYSSSQTRHLCRLDSLLSAHSRWRHHCLATPRPATLKSGLRSPKIVPLFLLVGEEDWVKNARVCMGACVCMGLLLLLLSSSQFTLSRWLLNWTGLCPAKCEWMWSTFSLTKHFWNLNDGSLSFLVLEEQQATHTSKNTLEDGEGIEK